MTDIEKLSKAMLLLEYARLRKTGYQRWDKSAIWFCQKEQVQKIATMERLILRLQNYCRQKAINILIQIG